MSVRICFTIFVFTLVLSNVTHGQDSLKRSAISLSIGLNKLSNKDAFQSPYTYKGTNLLLDFMYTKTSRKGEHVIDVTYSGGHIKSIVSPTANNQLFLFYYDYLFNLKTKNSATKIHTIIGHWGAFIIKQYELPSRRRRPGQLFIRRCISNI